LRAAYIRGDKEITMKFYGQFDPPVDKLLYERYFPEKRGGLFVECGAAEGTLESSCKFFEESMGWRGINIEASPRLFRSLIATRPTSFLNINVALSSQNGTKIFQDIVSPAGHSDAEGSLDHCAAQRLSILARGWGFQPVEVKTVTYSGLMEAHAIQEVDLMVLDVEGHELQVIEGMVGSRAIPKVMCVEYSYSGLKEIGSALAGLGFKLDFTRFVNAYYSRD